MTTKNPNAHTYTGARAMAEAKKLREEEREKKVTRARELHASGVSQADIAVRMGMGRDWVREAVRGMKP